MKIAEEIEKNGAVLFRIRGKSMEPILHEGLSAVCLERIDGDINKSDVLLFRREDERFDCGYVYVLHRVIKVEKDGSLIMCGDNLIVFEEIMRSDVLGIMTGFYDGDRYVDCYRNKRYKLYVKTWNLRYAFRFLKRAAGKAARKIKRVLR